MKFVELSNGAIFRADRIAAIVRQELNQFVIVVDESPVTFKADSHDVAELKKLLGADLTILPTKPAEEVKTKLQIAD